MKVLKGLKKDRQREMEEGGRKEREGGTEREEEEGGEI